MAYGQRRSFDQMGAFGQQAYEADFEANNASRFWQKSLDTLASGGMPKGWTPKGANTPTYDQWLASGGVENPNNPKGYDYSKANYDLPSFTDPLSNLPIAAALAFGSAGALGGLDQFAAGAGSGVTGGAGAVADVVPMAGSTGPGVSPAFNPAITPGANFAPAVDGLAITGGGSNLASTPLSRLLGVSQGTSDLLSVGGTGLATLLGMYGSKNKSNDLSKLMGDLRADRAPFLKASTDWLSNPAAYFAGPGKAAMDATVRAVSAKYGNPADSPTAQALIAEIGLRDWRNAVMGFGGLGTGGEQTQAVLGSRAADSTGDILTTLGGGIADILHPKPQYRLSIGGL